MKSKTAHYIYSSLNNGIKSSDQFMKSRENPDALNMGRMPKTSAANISALRQNQTSSKSLCELSEAKRVSTQMLDFFKMLQFLHFIALSVFCSVCHFHFHCNSGIAIRFLRGNATSRHRLNRSVVFTASDWLFPTHFRCPPSITHYPARC